MRQQRCRNRGRVGDERRLVESGERFIATLSKFPRRWAIVAGGRPTDRATGQKLARPRLCKTRWCRTTRRRRTRRNAQDTRPLPPVRRRPGAPPEMRHGEPGYCRGPRFGRTASIRQHAGRGYGGTHGLPLGELFVLKHLAEDCAADGRYDFMLVSAPLHVAGGIASPPNAVAIK